MARGDEQPPPIYECHPPGWLPKAHGSANLGTSHYATVCAVHSCAWLEQDMLGSILR